MIPPKRLRCGLALVLLVVGGLAAVAGAKEDLPPRATLAADGRSFTVTMPGFTGLAGTFSARIKVGEERLELPSSGGVAVGPVERVVEATPYGSAELSAVTLRFEKEQVELLLRIGRVPGVPGILAQAGLRNVGSQPVAALVLRPVELAGQVAGNPADWLVTTMRPTDGQQTKLAETGEQVDLWESGGLYRRDGAGVFIGPVGTPISYLNTRIAHGTGGDFALKVAAQMTGVRVDPGETRWGQQVVLLAEPPQPALARWAEWVGKTHGARTAKGALSGWSSWYFLGGEVSGKDVLEVAEAALKSPERLRPEVIQIDGGYEDPLGKKETNEKFPEGLGFYAQRLAATGARPGLQVNFPAPPDGPVVLDREAWISLTVRVRQAVLRGFTYLKIDLYQIPQGPSDDPKKTSFEAMRGGFTWLREAAGEETYLLHCDREPNRAAVGLVDASRTGRAADRGGVREAMTDVLRSYQLHDRWFAVDNCNYYMGTDVSNLSAITGGWPLVRTWMSMVGLSCGTAITSDPWQWEGFLPYRRNVEVMTPPARERTAVLDLCTSEDWPRLVGHVRREWGDMAVALLWNPGTAERTVALDFAAAGLDPHRRYAVWSFWDNRYLGVASGAWTSPALAPSASQHLRFTDLDRTPNQPVVIGSNLHIYCGAAETRRVISRRGALEIELTDAGARDGDLFVYSRLPLVLKTATGCAVTGVAQAGEYAWRISLADRQRGAVQRVELKVLLPVTQQLWFWLLIATVLASLAFAAWRSVVGLRLQRQHALDEERARIARDLHDEIGANLTHISILSTLAAKPAATDARAHHVEVANVARQTILAFDEILWSVNPRNDTLQSLSHYLCRRTEEILAPAQVAHHFSLDESLPERIVPPQCRHGLLLAVKEALHNILKHARATCVEVQCTMDGGAFVVRVADNGCGFDPQTVAAAPPGRQGHGLENMRRRLAELGGSCHLESHPGGGTRITFRLPLD
ncbi:MAG: ATP-binding protein [Chthoniobacter sp.]|nr:ATP-binding protein [Chthoniobacter sp.]